MKLLIGLGNPGKQYDQTRHNIGFMVLDNLAGKNKWHTSKKANALYLWQEIADQEVELFKPQTFMNASGLAVALAMKKHNLEPKDIIVIHDDKDLLLGDIRTQTDRSAAGHNGIKSIIEHLGTQDFTRIRIGIASDNPRKMSDTSKFVLNRFGMFEKMKVKKAIDQAIEEIKKLI
ncbi:MAG: aminoacyl-tRNA hydrolase [Parcubacteria group bacterium CG1_02_37_51]|uniref:Peptidyl-tRNA hydrolase n=2 Tax=Candidatus Komeiliibacteriota TaxID=1817908 RepID=A0A2M8DQM2_9BACT|nr:MAG: aminoacyl-tRNA hydrolase [Parcubacteria group bacterium CG1_02_37_51]PIY95290.1 MAG: aminoacyl-tRNA hydrolase [Candidatus Komeilibacteria bacterium CG_4_10_14_0_8_um_filter_37_78]PJC01533.1 MAG: aminoacyl-tRNA hydrolase [Candidatus Komeilibacteria bacterium CG_4_9_14_0_8_um_filter_36_9]